MFSTKWLDPAPVSGGAEAVTAAVSDVAERSFFAMVEVCGDKQFTDLAEPHDDWLSAVVRFEDQRCAGAVTCRLPMLLAEQLFDAFSGSDPDDPAPLVAEIHDLIGEFANMICGSWLTRAANERTFALSPPMVRDEPLPATVGGAGVVLTIDNQPCLITIDFTPVPEAAATH